MTVPSASPLPAGRAGPARFVGQQVLEVDRFGAHVQETADVRPLGARPVAIDLDAVAVRIGEVERFADTVVRRALQHGFRLDQTSERSREVRARRHQDREVVEARGAAHARCRLALREDQQVAAAGAERGAPLVAAVHDEAHVGLIETDRPIEIGNRQETAPIAAPGSMRSASAVNAQGPRMDQKTKKMSA